jgi:hypothetical protein
MKAKYSWIVLWKPGSKLGPCWTPLCSHPRCERIRYLASQICPLCNESLGYQVRLTELRTADLPHGKGPLCHQSCVTAHKNAKRKAHGY